MVCADLQPVSKITDSTAWGPVSEERSYATHEMITTRYRTGRAVSMRCDVSVEGEWQVKAEEAAQEGLQLEEMV